MSYKLDEDLLNLFLVLNGLQAWTITSYHHLKWTLEWLLKENSDSISPCHSVEHGLIFGHA